MEEHLRLGLALCGAALLVAVAFLAFRGTWHMYGKLASASEEASAAVRTFQSLEARQAQIQSDIDGLSTARGMEGELRERYGFAKPGEGVIQVVDKDQSGNAEGTAQNEGLFQKIFHTLLPW